MTQTASDGARQLARGDDFEGHRIIELIAQGGRSLVYEALHAQAGERRALKILAGTVSEKEAARFREAFSECLPSPKHDRLEQTFTGGVTSEGRVWFSGELLPGRSFEARLSERGPLSAEEGAKIATQIAHGLQAIHAGGFLHRNLKPSNVLLLDDGTVKLLDIGLSICAPKDHPLSTPQMTSPEEISRAGLDTRADVYSLGALIFQLVTGEPPFSGTLEQVTNGHLYEPPPRLRALRPGAVALGDIVNRAMAKRPGNRFQSMAEMAEALERAQGQQSVAPQMIRTPPNTRERKRMHLWLAVVVAVATMIAFAFCRWKNLL